MIWTIGSVVLRILDSEPPPPMWTFPGGRIWAFPRCLQHPTPLGYLSPRRPQISRLLADHAPSDMLVLNHLPHLGTRNVLTSVMSPHTVKNPTHHLSHLFSGIILLLFLFFSLRLN